MTSSQEVVISSHEVAVLSREVTMSSLEVAISPPEVSIVAGSRVIVEGSHDVVAISSEGMSRLTRCITIYGHSYVSSRVPETNSSSKSATASRQSRLWRVLYVYKESHNASGSCINQ